MLEMNTKETLIELFAGLQRLRDWEYRRLVEEDLSNPYWIICLERGLIQLNIAINELNKDKPASVAVSVDKMMAEYGPLLEVTEAARVFADCYIIKEPDDRETKALLSALARLDEARRG